MGEPELRKALQIIADGTSYDPAGAIGVTARNIARAGLSGDSRANGEPGPGSLDGAWAEAEAATEAWGVTDRFVSIELSVFRTLADVGKPVRYLTSAERIAHRQPTSPPAVTHDEEAEADTPAAALIALASRLRALREAPETCMSPDSHDEWMSGERACGCRP